MCLTIFRLNQFLNQTVVRFKLTVIRIVVVCNDELGDLPYERSTSQHDCNSGLVGSKPRHNQPFFFRARFCVLRCFSFASRLSNSSFDTLNTCRIALSNRSKSVLPGTFGAGNGFMRRLYPSKASGIKK